jgi:hypothetical protein
VSAYGAHPFFFNKWKIESKKLSPTLKLFAFLFSAFGFLLLALTNGVDKNLFQ